jgi:hypothetical protein
MATPLFNTASMGSSIGDGLRVGNVLPLPYAVDPYAPFSSPGVDVQGYNVTQLVPLAANATNVAAAQIVAANANFVLAAGTNTEAVTINGKNYISLIPAANVPALAAGGLVQPGTPARGLIFTTILGFPAAAVNFTINGLDCYGEPVSEIVTTGAAGGAGTKRSLKTYSAIYSITSDTATVSNVTVGTTDLIGLQFYTPSFDYFASVYWNQIALTAATSGFVKGITTTASATTGDVRGTILLPAGTPSNGSIRLVIHSFVAGNTKPQAAQGLANYVGVPQFANSF